MKATFIGMRQAYGLLSCGGSLTKGMLNGRATWAIEPVGYCVKPRDAEMLIQQLAMRPSGDGLPFGIAGLDQSWTCTQTRIGKEVES
jgi:hypothetical protein